jgi:hypothetical protein
MIAKSSLIDLNHIITSTQPHNRAVLLQSCRMNTAEPKQPAQVATTVVINSRRGGRQRISGSSQLMAVRAFVYGMPPRWTDTIRVRDNRFCGVLVQKATDFLHVPDDLRSGQTRCERAMPTDDQKKL